MTRRRVLLVSLCLLPVLAIAAAVAWLLRPMPEQEGPWLVTVSPGTTWITSPLREDGTVDHVLALDAILAEGVTPESNALPLLVEALGPGWLGGGTLADHCARLGIPEPPADGAFFVDFETWLARTSPGGPGGAPGAVEREADRAEEGPWVPEDCPRVAAWLSAMEGPLARIAAAARLPRMHLPLRPSDSPLVLGLPTFREGALLITGAWHAPLRRAFLRLGRGETAAAAEDLRTCLGLARLLRERPALTSFLIGVIVEIRSLAAIRRAAAAGALDEAGCRTFLWLVRDLPPAPSLADRFARIERLVDLDLLSHVARRGLREALVILGEIGPGSPGPSPGVDWDEVSRRVNGWADRLDRAMRVGGYSARRKALGEVLDEFCDPDPRRLIWSGRPGGRCDGLSGRVDGAVAAVAPELAVRRRLRALAGEPAEAMGELLFCTLPPVGRRIARLEAERSLTLLVLALKGRRAAGLPFPETLDELVPAWLPAVPPDPFRGVPPDYGRTAGGYVLRCIDPEGDPAGDLTITFP